MLSLYLPMRLFNLPFGYLKVPLYYHKYFEQRSFSSLVDICFDRSESQLFKYLHCYFDIYHCNGCTIVQFLYLIHNSVDTRCIPNWSYPKTYQIDNNLTFPYSLYMATRHQNHTCRTFIRLYYRTLTRYDLYSS